jgi:transposase
LGAFLGQFDDATFVLESTGIWEFNCEGIEARGFPVMLAHPLKVRAIAEAKSKTDEVDARTPAQLLGADMAPRSYFPSRDIRDHRRLVRQHSYLVQKCTGFKNRIHAEPLRRGIRRPENPATPFSQKSEESMRSLNIVGINADLDCLDALQAQVEELSQNLFLEFQRRHEAQLIATIHGIGYYGALIAFAEIADVHRFSDPEHPASCAGLVPSVSQSASTCH